MDTFNSEFRARLNFVIAGSCSLIYSSKAGMDLVLISPSSLFSSQVRLRCTLSVFAYINCDGCLRFRGPRSLLVGADCGIAAPDRGLNRRAPVSARV